MTIKNINIVYHQSATFKLIASAKSKNKKRDSIFCTTVTIINPFFGKAYSTLVGAVGREEVCFLEGSEMGTLAGLAFSIQADRLDLDYVVCLLFQVPKHTGSAGGVHLPNKPLHVAILPLKQQQMQKALISTFLSCCAIASHVETTFSIALPRSQHLILLGEKNTNLRLPASVAFVQIGSGKLK